METVEHYYNLNDERPTALLLGNGLTRGSGGLSWNQAIIRLATDNNVIKEFMMDPDDCEKGFKIPYTPLALVTASTDDSERHSQYEKVFYPKEFAVSKQLKRLVSLPFSALLTTNYTYEIENALMEGFSQLTRSTQLKRSVNLNQKNRSDRYLIQRCNHLSPSGPQIWHIHGEVNRKSSIILTHDEYARLVSAMLTYLRVQENRYYNTMDHFAFLSWIDYLLVADVYILGLGLDFSEFDIWWMLGRRLREKAKVGRIVYYEHESDKTREKHLALSQAGVEVESLGFNSQQMDDYPNTNAFYDAFYDAAICNIEKQFQREKN